jgi:hypothetical protein
MWMRSAFPFNNSDRASSSLNHAIKIQMSDQRISLPSGMVVNVTFFVFLHFRLVWLQPTLLWISSHNKRSIGSSYIVLSSVFFVSSLHGRGGGMCLHTERPCREKPTTTPVEKPSHPTMIVVQGNCGCSLSVYTLPKSKTDITFSFF